MNRTATGLWAGAIALTAEYASAEENYFATARRHGNQVMFEIAGPQDLVCSGKTSGEIRRNEERSEWEISFHHKQHGRAEIRAVWK